MTLEAAIAEQTKAIGILTEAVNKSNDLAERMIGLKTEAIETVKATAAPTEAKPKATTTAKPTETKADPAPAPETTKADKPVEKELDPIAQAISAYVGEGYDSAHAQAADERKARSAKVKEIFAAIAGKAGVEVKKHTEIPEAFHGAFLKTLAKRVEEGSLVIGKTADDDLLGS